VVLEIQVIFKNEVTLWMSELFNVYFFFIICFF
jgi:hypothetical protein